MGKNASWFCLLMVGKDIRFFLLICILYLFVLSFAYIILHIKDGWLKLDPYREIGNKYPFLKRKYSGRHNVKMGEYPHNSDTLPVSDPPYFYKVASFFNDPNNAACVRETMKMDVIGRGGRRQSVVTLVVFCKLARSPVTTSVSLTHNYTHVCLQILRF